MINCLLESTLHFVLFTDIYDRTGCSWAIVSTSCRNRSFGNAHSCFCSGLMVSECCRFCGLAQLWWMDWSMGVSPFLFLEGRYGLGSFSNCFVALLWVWGFSKGNSSHLITFLGQSKGLWLIWWGSFSHDDSNLRREHPWRKSQSHCHRLHLRCFLCSTSSFGYDVP